MTYWPARALGALFTITGTLHFLAAEAFESVIPSWLGPPRPWVYGSGVAELVAAFLLFRRCPFLGGKVAFVVLLGVWPANVYAAWFGGYSAAPSPLDSAWFAWLRVPLQLPLLWMAFRASGWRNRGATKS